MRSNVLDMAGGFPLYSIFHFMLKSCNQSLETRVTYNIIIIMITKGVEYIVWIVIQLASHICIVKHMCIYTSWNIFLVIKIEFRNHFILSP